MQVTSTSDIVSESDYVTYIRELCIKAIKLVNDEDVSGLHDLLVKCSMKYPQTGVVFPRLQTAQVLCLQRLGRLKEGLELARDNLNSAVYDPELIELIVQIQLALYKQNFDKIQQAINEDESQYRTFAFGRFSLCLDPSERGSIYTMACCNADIFEPFEKSIFGEIICNNPDCLVIDIGASYGVYTLVACDLVNHKFGRKVVAVEPDRRVFKKLSESVALNGFDTDAILINKAVSDSDNQQVTLFVNTFGSVDNRSFTHGQINVGESYDVDAVTIDSIVADIEKSGIKPRTIIVKIDIQGNEPRAIRGMSKTLLDYESVAVLLEFDEAMLKDAAFNPSDFARQLFTAGFEKIIDINETARSLRILHEVDDLLEAIKHCDRCRSVNQRDPRRFMNLLCYRNIEWSFLPSESDKFNGRTNAGWVDSFSAEQRLLCIMYETLMEITLNANQEKIY